MTDLYAVPEPSTLLFDDEANRVFGALPGIGFAFYVQDGHPIFRYISRGLDGSITESTFAPFVHSARPGTYTSAEADYWGTFEEATARLSALHTIANLPAALCPAVNAEVQSAASYELRHLLREKKPLREARLISGPARRDE